MPDKQQESRFYVQLRPRLIKANSGEWESIFVHIGANRHEAERFPCHLSVTEESGLIDARLTYMQLGKVARSAFRDLPETMHIQAGGHWSLGPHSSHKSFRPLSFAFAGFASAVERWSVNAGTGWSRWS